jgi:hypothetical protein
VLAGDDDSATPRAGGVTEERVFRTPDGRLFASARGATLHMAIVELSDWLEGQLGLPPGSEGVAGFRLFARAAGAVMARNPEGFKAASAALLRWGEENP